MEETSVTSKKTSSRVQGTYLCSIQGKHVLDKDTQGMFPPRLGCQLVTKINCKAGN
jgi:hypothetical protein